MKLIRSNGPVLLSTASPNSIGGIAPAAVPPEETSVRDRSWWAGFSRLLTAARPEDYRRGFYVFAMAAMALFLLVNMRGPCLQLVDGHDDLVFLDNAWKVYNGLRPHADFGSAMGALHPWIYAAGFAVLGPTAMVLPFCNALVALAVGMGAWVVAFRRLPAWSASLFAFTQMLVAITPHLLRGPVYAASYAGYYNRQGHALLAILMLALFVPESGGQHERDNRRAGRTAGFLLSTMLFLKVSYFLVGIGLCITAVVCARRRGWVFGRNIVAAFVLVFVACLPLIRFDLAGMWHDLRMASSARSATPDAAFTIERFTSQFGFLWMEFALLALLQLSLRSPWIFRRDAQGLSAPAWTELCMLTGAGMFIYMTNAPNAYLTETPVLASWLFVIGANILRQLPNEELQQRLPIVCGLAGVLWIFTFGTGLASFGWSTLPWRTPWQQAVLEGTPRFNSEALVDLPMYGRSGEGTLPDPISFVYKVNDGLRMLRKLEGVHHVAALEFENPFPFAMQWPALRGNLWAWHLGYTFSATACPTPAQAFDDADVLMIPKYPAEPPGFPVMVRVYGSYIKEHFSVVDVSDQWTLMRRKR